ncbi:YbdK family carboxylate-amine ligase [Edaphovirga cremea]|uniref:YbdK family carboxylate-amine ligase n=1 Tax=Edaphovirga cremea TaxID=2267246 RepID=UPI00130058E9|nr:YbdK family carboxylate-amine ligase [Edaphovirga cremea]
MSKLPFKSSPIHSIGTELELQLIDLEDFDLSSKGIEVISRYCDEQHVKKELSLSTIEMSSSVHATPFTLFTELNTIARNLSEVAACYNCGLCGGGRHISNHWTNQTITPTQRYREIHQRYGFLAKLSCVFGQHIHIGVRTGDDAIYLCHVLTPYLPHFIALTASSPFYQSEDTLFDSSRFSALNSFYTFGIIDHTIATWNDFSDYVEAAIRLGVIKCLKDIYWEVRPKPEFGTIEIRVCDTPLTLLHAAMVCGYAQLLVKHVLKKRVPIESVYTSFVNSNTFNAQRYGFKADYIDSTRAIKTTLKSHMEETFNNIWQDADAYEKKVLRYFKVYLDHAVNDADFLRGMAHQGMSESSIVRTMMNLFILPDYIGSKGNTPQ